jgi:hypothetical protein
LHEDYQSKVITREDFISFKTNYDVKISEAETAAQLLKEDIERLVAGESDSHEWIEKFKSLGGGENLERRAVAELIEAVKVFDGGRIEVIFRYINEYERLKEAA